MTRSIQLLPSFWNHARNKQTSNIRKTLLPIALLVILFACLALIHDAEAAKSGAKRKGNGKSKGKGKGKGARHRRDMKHSTMPGSVFPAGCGECNEPNFCYTQGLTKGRSGQMEEAIICLQRSAAMDPTQPKVWSIMAEASLYMGKKNDALQYGTMMTRVSPEDPEGFFMMGNAYMGMDKVTDALNAFKAALRADPDHVLTHVNLGALLGNINDLQGSMHHYERAVQLDPTLVAAKHNYASALHSLKQHDKAEEMFKEIVRDNPEHFEAVLSLGHVQREIRKLEAAKQSYARALELRPDGPDALLNYFYAKQQVVDWEERDELFQRLLSLTEEELRQSHLTTVSPYFSLLSKFTQHQMLMIAKHHARRAEAKVQHIRPWPRIGTVPLPSQSNIPKIGYIGADFRMHVTAHLIQTVFSYHSRVSPFVFALNQDDRSRFRQNIRSSLPEGQFIEAFGRSDVEVAEIVNSLGLHVLVDIDYYKNRMQILVFRPCQIQVNFLAHPGTSGADYIDFIVVDKIVAPPENYEFFTEKFLLMHHHYQVNDHAAMYPRKEQDRAQLRRKENLPQDAVVLCNFNSLYKFEPNSFSVWMRVMKRAPKSVLWLVSDGPECDENLRHQARERGVDPSRIILADRADFDKHIQRAAAADVFLDSFVYNAHTTAADVLWSGGIPVVTLPDDIMHTRLAAGVSYGYHPSAQATTACSREDYEHIATVLATNERARLGLRNALLEAGPEGSPLFDSPAWIADFENTLVMAIEAQIGGYASKDKLNVISGQ